jgi:DNA-binding transcriptional ArsR family regulator
MLAIHEDEELATTWRALSDPTRRRVLDLLRSGPMTTGQVAGAIPDLSRFAVMKHLSVLEEADLVVVVRRGRERWNHLNAVPIQRIYERWISPFEGLWASSLLRLKRNAERKGGRDGGDG